LQCIIDYGASSIYRASRDSIFVPLHAERWACRLAETARKPFSRRTKYFFASVVTDNPERPALRYTGRWNAD